MRSLRRLDKTFGPPCSPLLAGTFTSTFTTRQLHEPAYALQPHHQGATGPSPRRGPRESSPAFRAPRQLCTYRVSSRRPVLRRLDKPLGRCALLAPHGHIHFNIHFNIHESPRPQGHTQAVFTHILTSAYFGARGDARARMLCTGGMMTVLISLGSCVCLHFPRSFGWGVRGRGEKEIHPSTRACPQGRAHTHYIDTTHNAVISHSEESFIDSFHHLE